MKIKKFLCVFFIFAGCSNIQNAETIPDDFYMRETYKTFLKNDLGEYYSIEKRVNNNFSAILEIYDKKNNKMVEKYENKYINPVEKSSYNDYYQISKKYEYEKGSLIKTTLQIGKSENCFVKCSNEILYTNNKVNKVINYPSCLSLVDMKKRTLDYNNSYVKNNCIVN